MILPEQLALIMPQCPDDNVVRYATALSFALDRVGLRTITEVSALIGQIALESGELRWWREIPSATDPRFRRYEMGQTARNLGNHTPGDGLLYSGRGPIQITGRRNYATFGVWLKMEFEIAYGHTEILENPDLLATDPDIGFLSAAWYWLSHCAGLANQVSFVNDCMVSDNYRKITRAINGGYRHYDQRVKYYLRALQVLGAR
jgi:predicted chitinase